MIQPIRFSINIVSEISAFTNYPEEAREILEFMSSEERFQMLYEVRDSNPAVKDASTI